VLETERLVQPLRRLVGSINIGDHLAKARGSAGVDEGRQQTPPDAGMQVVRVHVDRMLDGVTVGRTFAERYRIGVADDGAGLLGGEMRQLALEHVLAPTLDVLGVQRFEVEGAEAALDVVGIDRKHRCDVVLGGGTHDYFGCGVERRRAGRQ
jgi:hypothetical protein